MKRKNRVIAGLLYVVSMIVALIGAFAFTKLSVSLLTLSTALILIPWIMCIIAASRKGDEAAVWILFLLFGGAVAIPMFLLTKKEENKPVLYTNKTPPQV